MGTGIFAIQESGQLVEMIESPYNSEAILQELLEKYPNLLAGDQINSAEPRRWLLVAREMSVPCEENGAGRWSVDHLFLDQEGIPTLVEVKRSSDTRIRREVVGQMLDYAANGVMYWPVERIRASFEASCQAQNTASQDVLMAYLEETEESFDPERFWQQVATNLQLGRIRMLFVADAIPTELQRIIEFLNVQMNPAEVLGVEIRQFVGQGLKTLVPRVFGLTAEAQKNKTFATRESRQWDLTSLMQKLEEKDPHWGGIVQKIVDWAKQRDLFQSWGKGTTLGSFIPVLVHQNIRYQLFAVWTSGVIGIGFRYICNKSPFDTEANLSELLEKLNAVPGVSISSTSINKLPEISLSVLESETSLDQYLQVFDWAIAQIKSI